MRERYRGGERKKPDGRQEEGGGRRESARTCADYPTRLQSGRGSAAVEKEWLARL